MSISKEKYSHLCFFFRWGQCFDPLSLSRSQESKSSIAAPGGRSSLIMGTYTHHLGPEGPGLPSGSANEFDTKTTLKTLITCHIHLYI